MAVKCILTGQTPSVLDGVTENVQTQIDDKQPKIIADGILKGDGNSNISAAVKGTDYDTEIGIVHYEDSFDSVEAAYNKSKRLFCSENPADYVGTDSDKLYALLNRSQPYISDGRVEIKYTFTCLDKTITLTRTKQNSTATPVDTWAKGSQAFNPRLHASTHKTGGSDAIAPSDIGAQTKITANGVLKGDGSGNISAATATDIPGLDGKQATITGAATTITNDNLTANRALISNSSGKVEVSAVTSTELGYLDGVTSNIQTQLNSKLSSAPVTSVNNKTGAVTLAKGDVGLSNVDNTSDANKPISNATQAALNDKQSKITANGILKGDGSGNITAANETEVELVSLPNICNPNLLDNWYFGNPVNQRGKTEYTGSGYTVDRWRLNQWNATSVACSIVTKGLRVRGEAPGPCSTTIKQFVEGLKAGCQVTASVLVTDFTAGANVYLFIRTNSGVGLASVRFSAPGLYSVTTTLPDDFDGNLMIEIGQGGSEGGNGNTDFAVLAVKLELGSQQTLAHQENGKWVLNEIPDYGEQLRRCQRYYWKVDHNDWPGVSPFSGTYNGERITLNGLTFPVTMRTKPTISNLILYENGSGSSKTVTDSGWGLFDYTYNNIFPTSENLVSGNTYSVQHVEFSADL